MQGNHENQNLFFELTTFFFPAKKNLVGNLQIYGILLLTRKRNFKNVDNTFGTNHSTRKTQSKNFLIFYVLHKIGIFKDAAEQLHLFYFYKNAGLISGKGIGIQGLSSKALHRIIVPLPPLAEQKRIVIWISAKLWT